MNAIDIQGAAARQRISLDEGLLGNALPLRSTFLNDGEGDQVAGFDVDV